MPVFNGYYVDRGSCMLRINPRDGGVSLCVNYGNFSEMTGIGVGDTLNIAMKEKGSALATQEINNLVYSNDRADFPSDAVFANFRPVAEAAHLCRRSCGNGIPLPFPCKPLTSELLPSRGFLRSGPSTGANDAITEMLSISLSMAAIVVQT